MDIEIEGGLANCVHPRAPTPALDPMCGVSLFDSELLESRSDVSE